MSIEARIFKNLLLVIPNLSTLKEYAKSEASGFMDLHCDVLYTSGDTTRIALQHYYRHPSGDSIPDPDMTLDVNFKLEKASAVSYQDAYRYQTVEDEDAPETLREQLNLFLNYWLCNLKSQGHKIE